MPLAASSNIAGSLAAFVQRRPALAIFLAALLAMALRAPFLDQRGFWIDEYYTLQAVELSTPDLIQNRLEAGHSPLYFLYARWPLLLGMRHEAGLRLSSLLASGFAVAFFGLALRSLAGPGALAPALLIAVLQPYWFTAATEYRYMMPLAAVVCLCLWLAARFVAAAHANTRERDLAWLALTLGLALLLALHASALFVATGFALALAWIAARRPVPSSQSGLLRAWRIAGFASSVGFALLMVTPLLLLLRDQGKSGRRKPPSFGGNIKDLTDVTFGNHELWAHWIGFRDTFTIIVAVGFFATAVWLARRYCRENDLMDAWRLLVGIAVGIPLITILISVLLRDTQGPARYFAGFGVPAAALLTLGFLGSNSVPWGRYWRPALIVFLALQALVCGLDRGDRQREATYWIIQNAEEVDHLLVSTDMMNRFALDYLGYDEPEVETDGIASEIDSESAVASRLDRFLPGHQRGLLLLYHSSDAVFEVLKERRGTPPLLDYRLFPISRNNVVGAWIADESERAWLVSLKPPALLWGEGRDDNMGRTANLSTER